MPLPHDDVSPTEAESLASLTAKPLGRAWFHEYDELPDHDYELPADQQDE